MKPVTFDLKDHKDNWERHDFGFIAEDMEAINPPFVTYDEDDEVSGVRYMQLTAVTPGIQELHAKEVDDVVNTPRLTHLSERLSNNASKLDGLENSFNPRNPASRAK
jgi:hypothetical protein